MLIKSLMVPTKSSLCSPLNSYSLCLCLPSVPKRRERKKPTSHALKEKLVGVFLLVFSSFFSSFLRKPDLWCLEDAFALLEHKLLLYWKKHSSLGSRPCLFAGLVWLVFHLSDVGGQAACHVHRIKTKQKPFLLFACN